MTRIWLQVLTAACLIALLAGSASAQSAIAGSARDATGLALPGVAVDVASPALIERTRSAVTDGQGQYQITNLPPGTYKVSSRCRGSTLVREGPTFQVILPPP